MSIAGWRPPSGQACGWPVVPPSSVVTARAAAPTTPPRIAIRSSNIRAVGPATDKAAWAAPRSSKIGAATQRSPIVNSSSSMEKPRSRIRPSSAWSFRRLPMVFGVFRARPALPRDIGDLLACHVGEHRLARGGSVHADLSAGARDRPDRLVALYLRHADHGFAAAEDVEIDRFADLFHQPAHVGTRQRCHVPRSGKGVADEKCLDADLPAHGFRIEAHEALPLHRRQQAVGARWRQRDLPGKRCQGQAVVVPGEGIEDRQRPGQRLDAAAWTGRARFFTTLMTTRAWFRRFHVTSIRCCGTVFHIVKSLPNKLTRSSAGLVSA